MTIIQHAESQPHKTFTWQTIIRWIAVIILLFIASIGIFQKFYMDLLLAHTPVGDSAGLEPEYDPNAVLNATLIDASRAALDAKNVHQAGQIAIPSVNVNLPIFEGINQTHILLGAGEQRPRSEITMGGKGNYILASHNLFASDTALFAPIINAKVGDRIYTADKDGWYEYQITRSEEIDIYSDAAHDILSDHDTPEITLYTCTNQHNKSYRWIVQGELIQSKPISQASRHDLSYFLASQVNTINGQIQEG